MKPSRKLRRQLVVLVMLGTALTVFGLKHQAVQDWLRLHGYTAPHTVALLAADDTMTARARHLFYVNHPDVTAGSSFTDHCPAGGEKTVVLGCYVGADDGIYIYDVSDPRLTGVEQVTAAHEMLHAAYRRLSNGERSTVDAMLVDYYEHDLTDQRIKDTIAAYKKSEPNDVVNEMHSVFGTEVPDLPGPLEQYYRQYFTDRSKVTAYTAEYQGEFTNRRVEVAAYDTQLSSLKSQIDDNQAELDRQKTAIDSQTAQLQSEESNGQTSLYNSGVAGYNAAVDEYNGLLSDTKDLINQYNTTVSERNDVVLEEQQLTQALSPNTLPSSQ